MLETIALPGSGRSTSRLGFGGSGLMGGLSERESLLLLETAYDAGIRHFDVAPSYGHGQAEQCLGKFLRGKTEQITIATKYGMLAPSHAGVLQIARCIVRPVVRHLPAIRRRAAQAAAGLKTKARFSAEDARRSLDRSLRELEIDRIDLWLLHEATVDDLDDSDLLPFLQQTQRKGRIGAYGVGGERSHLDALWQRRRDYCSVLQFEWSALEGGATNFLGAFLIHHRAVSGSQDAIRNAFERDAALCRRWSKAIDSDLAQPEILAAVLLQAALAASPGGMVLFSSRNPEHIRANVRATEDATSSVRGQRFLKLIAEERDQICRNRR